jgi:hypothetical protein
MQWRWLRDVKILLVGGITFMALCTLVLIFAKAEKEYVGLFGGFTGQGVAAFLTYVTRTAKNGNGHAPKE